MNLNKVLFVVAAGLLFASCKNDSYQSLYIKPGAPDVCDTTTNPSTYSGNVKTILTDKCATAGCHNETTMQSGYDFAKYADSKSAADFGDLYNTIARDKSMPPGAPLTDCEIKQVVYWINKGALNN